MLSYYTILTFNKNSQHKQKFGKYCFKLAIMNDDQDTMCAEWDMLLKFYFPKCQTVPLMVPLKHSEF